MNVVSGFRIIIAVLALAVVGCEESPLEKAERDLATSERELTIKRSIVSRLDREIKEGKHENLSESLKDKKIKVETKIEVLTSDIELQKEKISQLKESD